MCCKPLLEIYVAFPSFLLNNSFTVRSFGTKRRKGRRWELVLAVSDKVSIGAGGGGVVVVVVASSGKEGGGGETSVDGR